jgi:hypothetical protein
LSLWVDPFCSSTTSAVHSFATLLAAPSKGTRGEDLTARLGVDERGPHSLESLVGKAFAAGEQPAPAGPFGVDLTAAATAMVSADPLAIWLSLGCCERTTCSPGSLGLTVPANDLPVIRGNF